MYLEFLDSYLDNITYVLLFLNIFYIFFPIEKEKKALNRVESLWYIEYYGFHDIIANIFLQKIVTKYFLIIFITLYKAGIRIRQNIFKKNVPCSIAVLTIF